MPAKKEKAKEVEVQVDEEAQAELDESTRLQSLCYNGGVVAKTRRMDANQTHLKLPSKLDGKDIVKRGNARKNKYLLNIPAQLSAMTAGKLGSLARLDTRNPVMYLDFSEGRLKFKGTLFFPKNKYMTLRLAPKEVRCEDIFESLIVFSEYCWIGTKDENPDEHPLPMPSTLALAPEEEKPIPESEPAIDMTQAEPTQATQGGATQVPPSLAEPAVRSSQRQTKRARYTENSSESDSELQDPDEESEEEVLPKRKARTSTSGGGKRSKVAASPAPIELSDNSEDEDTQKGTDIDIGSDCAAKIESQSQRSLPKRNARPKKSLATVLEDSDGERLEDEDPIEDDSDFG